MVTPFFICFREGIEIFLVIIPLLMYFHKKGLNYMVKSILLGSVVGATVSTVLGVIIFSNAASLEGPAGELYDGILGIVLASLILYSIVIIRKTKIVCTVLNKRFISATKKGVFTIAAITFFREFLEAILFILSVAQESPLFVTGSALTGLAAATALVLAVSKGITDLNINVVFYILNLFLVALGAYCFGDGLNTLFGNSVPEIFNAGFLVYAVPSYIIILKSDLKNFLNSNKIE